MIKTNQQFPVRASVKTQTHIRPCYLHGWLAETNTINGDTITSVVGFVEYGDGTFQTVWCENIQLVTPTSD